MSAVTESDVRRIVREEILSDRRRNDRDFAEHVLESSRRVDREDPAEPGSLLAEIRGLRRDSAEQGLAAVLLADVSGDDVEGVPELNDLRGGSVSAGFSAVDPLAGLGSSSGGSSAPHGLDGVDKVVAHDSSPSGSGQVLDTPDSPTPTVGEPAGGVPPSPGAPSAPLDGAA